MEAVNRSADAYVIKPVRIDDLLKTIRVNLEKQKQAKKYSENKIAEFIETRVKELDAEAQEAR
jgi:DNA-binding response OmpR family regulator